MSSCYDDEMFCPNENPFETCGTIESKDEKTPLEKTNICFLSKYCDGKHNYSSDFGWTAEINFECPYGIRKTPGSNGILTDT